MFYIYIDFSILLQISNIIKIIVSEFLSRIYHTLPYLENTMSYRLHTIFNYYRTFIEHIILIREPTKHSIVMY